METPIDGYSFYVGKLGADNLLLICVGLLFFLLYWLKKHDGQYERLKLYFWAGFFFSFYGFFYDLYRIKPLRPYLIYHFTLQPYKTISLLISLLPLYYYLIDSIVRLLKARYMRRKKSDDFS